MKKKYTFADFPRRDTANCLNDGDVARIYIPLLTEPGCPADLMERADSIINEMLASCPETIHNIKNLFIYVQLWITVLRNGRILHEISAGILREDDKINLYERSVVLRTDPVYASFKEYFSRNLISLLFDEGASITRPEMENGIYEVRYDYMRKMYMVEHTSIYSEELEPPRYFVTKSEAQNACKALIRHQKESFGGTH